VLPGKIPRKTRVSAMKIGSENVDVVLLLLCYNEQAGDAKTRAAAWIA
jgi:hypothetical protein